MPSSDPKFNFEVVKLLLQSAWADLELAQAEKQLILLQTRRLHLLEQDVETIRSCLRGERRLPPPDMGLLRIHREAVLGLVKEVLLCDQSFSRDEQEVLAEIEGLLGG
jgi:hypothetical protein